MEFNESYEEKSYMLAINMLASSSTFQSLCSVDSASAAMERIIEGDGGTIGENNEEQFYNCLGNQVDCSPPYAIMGAPTFSIEDAALGWQKRDGEILFTLY
jgi:hypothetical protein